MKYLQFLLILTSTALFGGLVSSVTAQSLAQPNASITRTAQAKTPSLSAKSWKTPQLVHALPIGQQLYQGRYASITALAIAPDSTTLAIGSHDYERAPGTGVSTLSLWDLKTGQLTRLLFQGAAGESFTPSDQEPTAPALYGDIVDTVAFSPDGQTVAAGLSNKTIKVWNRQTGAELYTLKGHTYAIHTIAFSPNGKTLISSSPDATIRVWDLQRRQLIRTIPTQEQTIGVLTVSPDGKRLATSGLTSRVQVWNLQTGQLVRTLGDQTKDVNAIAFSSDPQVLGLFNRICTASSPDAASVKSIQLWNWQTGKVIPNRDRYLQTFPATSAIESLSPDRQTTACLIPARSSLQQPRPQIILAQAKTGEAIHRFESNQGPFTFSPNGQLFIDIQYFGETVVQVWQ